MRGPRIHGWKGSHSAMREPRHSRAISHRVHERSINEWKESARGVRASGVASAAGQCYPNYLIWRQFAALAHCAWPMGLSGAAAGNSSIATPRPTSAPMNCATMKAGASSGRIPAKVFVRERAIVMAGLAKEVEAVNQYAAPIQAATIHGASCERR